MSLYPRHQRILFINPIAESLLQLNPKDFCLSLRFTNTDLCEAILPHDPVKLLITRSIKLNNNRSLSDTTKNLLNPKLSMNAVKCELA